MTFGIILYNKVVLIYNLIILTMLLNYWEIDRVDEKPNSINLEMLEVEWVDKNEDWTINRIFCSGDKILTAKDGLNDIDWFDLYNVKKWDLIRLKTWWIDKKGFSIIYEATSFWVDSILVWEDEVIDRIQRFAIWDLSFDEKYFLDDIQFLEKRINKIIRLIWLLGLGDYLNSLSKEDILDLKTNLQRIWEEIIKLSEKAKTILDNDDLDELNRKYLLSKLENFTRKGELIKSIATSEFDLNDIYTLEL